jgi:hypothetical protein
MLANNIDRDGRYFESSASYAGHTRNLYLTFTEPLFHYRGSAYPSGLNLYDSPAAQAFFLLPDSALSCLGLHPTFGDAKPITRPGSAGPPGMDLHYCEVVARRASDPSVRKRWANLLANLSDRGYRKSAWAMRWQYFHGFDRPLSSPGELNPRFRRLLDGSHFFGQKGIAVLRVGHGDSAHAASLRFGPPLVHGHLDDLSVNYHARGRDMTYDLGYVLGSSHVQCGFAEQTVSHNTVVVDEASQGGGMFGGDLVHFATFDNLALVEASSLAYAHRGVRDYRRLFALVPEYALDLFRVSGGTSHDLPLHSMSMDVEFAGFELGPEQEGSLAGPQWHWGEQMLADGDMKGHPGKPYWNPPPGNGYGFLMRPRWAEAPTTWSATWMLNDPEGTCFEMLALDVSQTSVVAVTAPGITTSHPSARHVMRRRRGKDLSSCFVSVWQSWNSTRARPVLAARRISTTPDSDHSSAPVALAVQLADRTTDYWCLGAGPHASGYARAEHQPMTWTGSVAQCRVDSEGLRSLTLVDASRWQWAGWSVTLPGSRSRADVLRVQSEPAAVDVEWEKTPPQIRPGDPICFSHPLYSRNSAYTVAAQSGEHMELELSGTQLGVGVVDAIRGKNTLRSEIVHEYARSLPWDSVPTGFFRGKRIHCDDSALSTTVRAVHWEQHGCTVDVDSTDGWKPGQRFIYEDIKPGDTAEVHHCVHLERIDHRYYRLVSNVRPVIVTPQGITVETEWRE